MPSPTPSEAGVQSLRGSAASSRRSNRSEQLDSTLSAYLRPSVLDDEEARENEDPNMYYETQSHKSGIEEMIEKNMQDESMTKPSPKENVFFKFAIAWRCTDADFCDHKPVSRRI